MSYVPILKGKEAEFRALQDLAPDVRSQVIPLIEILESTNAEQADIALESAASRLHKAWPDHSFMLDAGAIGSSLTSTGEHPLLGLRTLCAANNMYFIPVTSLSRSEEYQMAVRDIAQTPESQGICLRLAGADFEGDYPSHSVSDVLDTVGVHPSDTHLLIDFGPLVTDGAGAIALLTRPSRNQTSSGKRDEVCSSGA